jgi:NADPH-dependent glutamate synthase beta subunit-like oxidoreductase
VGIKRVEKKDLKSGPARSSGAGGSSLEQSPLRPRFVEKTPPCRAGCPQGTDIRGILTAIAKGEKAKEPREKTFEKVFYMIADKNPLPAICGRVCPHPCETACNRAKVDEPASINSVERFVGDWALEHDMPLRKAEGAAKLDERIAVIGSGPAGLACAYHLARFGYPVTIFEAFPKAGGMLRYGIPAYRLPRETIDAEVKRILDLGVELKLGVMVGRDVPFENLKKEYRAVFVGIGAHQGKKLGVPGEDAEGMWTGTAFLNRVNRGEKISVGKKVLVIGGGDTAIDAARVARRLGAEATIVYRRTRTEMPAIEPEVVGAEEEGIPFHFLAAPIEVLTTAGKVRGLRCQVMELGEPDSSGRRRPVPVPGKEFTLEADTIVAAISQEPDFTGVAHLREGRDWIKADEGGTTKEEGVFAGGDALELGLVTVALYQGRVAAETIHHQLRNATAGKKSPLPVIYHDKMALAYYEKKLRAQCESLSPAVRLADGDAEIAKGLTEEQAVAEAMRCMSCGFCMECGTCWSFCQDNAVVKPLIAGEPYKFKMEFCKGCKKCAEQCPCGYIEMYDPMVG